MTIARWPSAMELKIISRVGLHQNLRLPWQQNRIFLHNSFKIFSFGTAGQILK